MESDILKPEENVLFNTIVGNQNPDGTFTVSVKFENPITNRSITIKCLVDSGASNVVIAESDLKGEDLGMLFSNEDFGTSTIANGKKAVAPVHLLCVTTGIEGSPRKRPILHVPISQGSHSLLGMSYLNGVRAQANFGDGKLIIAKKWDGLSNIALALITSDNERIKELKKKYENKHTLRNLADQREYIRTMIKEKNEKIHDDNKLIMMSFIDEKTESIGINLGAIGPASVESHTTDITIPNFDYDEDINSINIHSLSNNSDNNDNIIGIDLGHTSYY